MQSVFINNFRGFTDTIIDLHTMNFFVGENSTGKTSVLALLNLLGGVEFWANFNFNTKYYEFGGYKDIVSIHSNERTEFQVGVYKPAKDDNSDILTTAYMLYFRKSREGLPKLSRFSVLTNSYLATIRRSENMLTVYLEKVNNICTSPTNAFTFLKNATNRDRSGFKVIDSESYLYGMPIVMMYPVIMSKVYKDASLHFNKSPFPSLTQSAYASMAPIRTTPKRTYDSYTKPFSPQGEHTPYILRTELSNKAKSNKFKKALDSFGDESGLFETVCIKQFGKDSSSPFELTIALTTKTLRINSVGYGVSQVLPIIVELLTLGKGSWLAIQQPEVHLHPRAQAALGDVLYRIASNHEHTLIVETHSDYLIDRYRIAVREEEGAHIPSQVIFFNRDKNGNHVYPMLIDKNGDYPKEQPAEFRDFFLNEQRRILEI